MAEAEFHNNDELPMDIDTESPTPMSVDSKQINDQEFKRILQGEYVTFSNQETITQLSNMYPDFFVKPSIGNATTTVTINPRSPNDTESILAYMDNPIIVPEYRETNYNIMYPDGTGPLTTDTDRDPINIESCITKLREFLLKYDNEENIQASLIFFERLILENLDANIAKDKYDRVIGRPTQRVGPYYTVMPVATQQERTAKLRLTLINDIYFALKLILQNVDDIYENIINAGCKNIVFVDTENLSYLRLNTRNSRGLTTHNRIQYINQISPLTIQGTPNDLISKDKIINLVKKVVMNKYNIPNDNKCFTIFCTNQRWRDLGPAGPLILLKKSADLSQEPFPCMLLSSQSETNEIDDYYLAFTTLLLRFIDYHQNKSINNYLLFSYDNFRWFDRATMPDVQLVELDNYSNFIIRNPIQPKHYFLSSELIREATDIVIAHNPKNVANAASILTTMNMGGGNKRKHNLRRKTIKKHNSRSKTKTIYKRINTRKNKHNNKNKTKTKLKTRKNKSSM